MESFPKESTIDDTLESTNEERRRGNPPGKLIKTFGNKNHLSVRWIPFNPVETTWYLMSCTDLLQLFVFLTDPQSIS